MLIHTEKSYRQNCSKMRLTKSQAVEIYQLKTSMKDDTISNFIPAFQPPNQLKRGHSVQIGIRYGVSSRTIRDVWNRKTWSFATQHLWSTENSFDRKMQVCKRVALTCFLRVYTNLCAGSSLLQKAWPTERLARL